jgi:uncharacterized protein (DUF3084 family)
MKHVLKVLNAFIESKVIEIESKDERIKEQWQEICQLEKENEMLRNDLAELSKEHFKK